MNSFEPGIHDESGASRVADLSARRPREQAWRQFAQARTVEEFCGSWLGIQCLAIGAVSDG